MNGKDMMRFRLIVSISRSLIT